MNKNDKAKYPLSMRIYHWLVFAMVVTMISVGYSMSGLEVSDEKWQIYYMHKSSGLLLFVIMLARIYNRLKSKIPTLPKSVSVFDAKIAHIVHYLLYIVLLIIPISGMLMSVFGGRGLPFFFTTFLKGVTRQENISGAFWIVHTKLPIILMILVGLHVIGSFKHLIIEKVNIFKRII